MNILWATRLVWITAVVFALACSATPAQNGPSDGSTEAMDAGGDLPVRSDRGATDIGAAGGDAARPPGDDFTVRSTAMQDYEGLTAFARFDHNVTPDSGSDTRSNEIVNGAFEIRWSGGFDRGTFGANVYLFVDSNADATCSDADPTWMFFANNPDFNGTGPVVVEFDPDPNGATVALVTVDCAAAGF